MGWGTIALANRKLVPSAENLDYWKAYFQDRVGELEPINGTVWGFVCACILLEVLTKLVNGKGTEKITRAEYERFIQDWLPATYSTFRYAKRVRIKTGGKTTVRDKSLPTQMYCILRCGVVHSYSFVAGELEIRNGGRSRSIWLTSRRGGTAVQAHLSQFSRDTILPAIDDAAFFIAEDFLQDISDAIEAVFVKAATDPALRALILKHLREQRPIGG